MGAVETTMIAMRVLVEGILRSSSCPSTLFAISALFLMKSMVFYHVEIQVLIMPVQCYF